MPIKVYRQLTAFHVLRYVDIANKKKVFDSLPRCICCLRFARFIKPKQANVFPHLAYVNVTLRKNIGEDWLYAKEKDFIISQIDNHTDSTSFSFILYPATFSFKFLHTDIKSSILN